MSLIQKMQELSISFEDSNESLIKKWSGLPPEFKNSENKILFKALLDPYYQETLKSYPDLNQLLPSGFFDDSLEPGIFNYKEEFFCTPIYKLIHRLKKLQNSSKPFVVMLNTGSYSPIHFGHVQMMESAYEALSEKYNVLAGYFSPSHDKYVSHKSILASEL